MRDGDAADRQLGVQVDILAGTSVQPVRPVVRLAPDVVVVGVERPVQALEVEIAGEFIHGPAHRGIEFTHGHDRAIAHQQHVIGTPLVIGITDKRAKDRRLILEEGE